MSSLAREASWDAISKGSKSFALASKLLPSEQRADVAAVYAWCRRADDAVDLVPQAEQRAALARLEKELASVYEGAPQEEPVLAAFQDTVRRCGIPSEYPFQMLSGMRLDVESKSYATVEDLLYYCYCVAGTVGAMMCHVLGVSQPGALRHAVHMGMAMQLTNISRDVEEDWLRGRSYVPSSLLGVSAGERPPAAAALSRARKALSVALAELLRESKRYYRSGDRGLVYLPLRAALAVRAARLIYSSIGLVLILRGRDVLRGRAVVPSILKVFLLFVALLLSAGEIRHRLRIRHKRAELSHVIQFPRDVLPV